MDVLFVGLTILFFAVSGWLLLSLAETVTRKASSPWSCWVP